MALELISSLESDWRETGALAGTIALEGTLECALIECIGGADGLECSKRRFRGSGLRLNVDCWGASGVALVRGVRGIDGCATGGCGANKLEIWVDEFEFAGSGVGMKVACDGRGVANVGCGG
jgi:hypothetical protein